MAERMIKTCLKHGETEFGYYKSGNSGHWRCLKCQTESTLRRRDKVKLMAVAYKGGKCQCCGYKNYVGALEFHHVNPEEKDFAFSSKGYTRSWEKNKEELDKCIIVCSNCHREIHAGIISCPTEIINDDDAAEKAAIDFDSKN